MFLTFNRRSDKIFVRLQQSEFSEGYLFFYNQNYTWCEVKSNSDEFVIDISYSKESSFVVCFISDQMYVGKNNFVLSDKIINGFCQLHKCILKEKKNEEEKRFDNNYIVDNIALKLFGYLCEEYYLRASKNLQSLLAVADKEKELEGVLKNSRFVSVGKKNNEMVVGLIYNKGRPEFIAMGSTLKPVDIDGKILDNFKCIHSKSSDKVYYLVFRRASDGEIL